jgi:hypothetical protein
MAGWMNGGFQNFRRLDFEVDRTTAAAIKQKFCNRVREAASHAAVPNCDDRLPYLR